MTRFLLMQHIVDNWQSAIISTSYSYQREFNNLTVNVPSYKGPIQWYMNGNGEISTGRSVYFNGAFYKIPFEFDERLDDIAEQLATMHKLST